METSKKVIILNNIKSKRIAQAIFILNDGETDEFSAVREAERLVMEYLDGEPLCAKKRPKALTLVCIFLSCVLVSFFLFLLLH